MNSKDFLYKVKSNPYIKGPLFQVLILVTFLTRWGSQGSGNGQFQGPADIAVDSERCVYVTDSGNRRVQKFTPDGTFLLGWTVDGAPLVHPRGISIYNDVFVLDWNNGRVLVFDQDGRLIRTWGSQGTGNGELFTPADIDFDSQGYVYITTNNRVQVYDQLGNFIRAWGSYGTGNEQFQAAFGLAIDSQDKVYVLEAGGNPRVQKFASDGTFITTWGSQGTGNGQFEDVLGIAIGEVPAPRIWQERIRIYVVDGVNNCIQAFEP